MVSSLFESGMGIVAAAGVGISDMTSVGDRWYGTVAILLVFVTMPAGAIVLGLLTGFKSRGAAVFGMFLGILGAFALMTSDLGDTVVAAAEVNELKTHYSISDIRFSYTDASPDDGGRFVRNMATAGATPSTVTFLDGDDNTHSGIVKVESNRVVLYSSGPGPSGSIIEYGTGAGSAKDEPSKPSRTTKPKPKSKKTNAPSKARKGTFRGTEPKTYDYTDEPVKGAQGAV